MYLFEAVIFFVISQFFVNVAIGIRTCTVIAPQFIHSARKYSLTLATNRINTSSQFEVTIESTTFKESQIVKVQPNGLQLVEFDLPLLPRDEYILRVKGEDGMYVQKSTLLKYAIYKPIFFIQINKFLYRPGETLHYRIICMDEVFRPKVPIGYIDIKIMTQDHRVIYHKKSAKLEHFIIRGELYLNPFEMTSTKSMPQFVARLTVSINSEVLAAVNFQIENDEWDPPNGMAKGNTEVCSPKRTPQSILKGWTKNQGNSSKNIFTIKMEKEGHENILKQNDVASFEISSMVPFQYLIYTIIGRGGIVQSERVLLLKEMRMYKIQFKPTNEMAPLSKILVYFIDDSNRLYYDEIMFGVEVKLENSISLSTKTSIVPNRKFELNITTPTNSYVGVLAIEEKSKTKTEPCADYIEDLRLQEILHYFGGHDLERYEITGDYILTSADIQNKGKRLYKKIWLEEEENAFPLRMESWRGTWIFAEISNTTSNNFILSHNLPNEDLRWRITAFAVNSDHGLGFTQLSPMIQTKKSYNITISTPDFIYENEIFNLPLRIDNFLSEEIEIRVEFIHENYDIELIPIAVDDVNSIQTISVPRRSHAEVKYTIQSRKAGVKALKFLLFSLAGDCWKNVEIRVKVKGVPIIENYPILIDLQDRRSFTKKFPSNENYKHETIVEYPILTVYGNLIDPLLQYLINAEDAQTAQQAASLMAMTCLSMNHLKTLKTDNVILETQLLRSMHKWALKALEYRDFDGGFFKDFSMTKSAIGSSWITAFVGMWLPCVRKYIDVDETVIETALNYLARTQRWDGSFREKGIIFNSLTGNDTLAITAHILIALLENEKYYIDYKVVLEKGIAYVVENLSKTENLYAKALAVYALYKAGLKDLYVELNNLERSVQIQKDYKFWAQGNNLELNNVATTALVLLTALGVSDNFEKSYKPALKWLIEQGSVYKYENRGLYPSHADVLSFEVLIRFVQIIDVATRADITIGYRDFFRMEYREFELKDRLNGKEIVTLDNFIGGLGISATGQGLALAHIKFNNHVLEQHNEPRFEVFIHKPSYNSFVSFILKVCVKYEGIKGHADLTILEIYAPSGYAIDRESLFRIVESKFIVKYASISNLGSKMKFYLVGLQRDEFECISMEIVRVHAIANQTSVPVFCYEYTDVHNMGVAYYDIERSICDLCEGSSNCNKNCYSHS